MAVSKSVTPDELLGDCILWDLTELVEVGTLFKVDVHAVAEADLLAANQGKRLHSKGILNLSAALVEAGERGLSDLLAEHVGLEHVLDVLLL